MDRSTIPQRAREVLVRSLALEGVVPAEIEDETPLREELGLDSVDVIELVLGLEKEFGLQIELSTLDRKSFQTVATLSAMIEERLDETPAGD